MRSSAPRITARVDQPTQMLLQQAALLSGIVSINSFVLNAAIEKAKQIIQAENTIQLNEEATQKLLEHLDNPVQPNDKLKSLFSEYYNE